MTARRGGLIAALILGVLFALTAVMTFGPNKRVIPTNGVTAGNKADNPGGLGALSNLQTRTRLQEWSEGSNSRPAQPSLALGPAGKSGEPRAAGEQRVQEWLGDRQAQQDILQRPSFRQGTSTLPAPESGVLVQPQGRTWRDVRNDKLAYGGALYIFGISLLIALFLAWRGRVPIKDGVTGQTVKRFNAFERANHWLSAVSFLLMALTGLVILYGNALIQPWLGAAAYAELARVSAWSHTTFAVPFVIGVLCMIALWTRQNLFERLDWQWLKRGGGLISDKQESPPARKFNAGQKLVFWLVVLGGLSLAVTGVVLMFPFYAGGYTGMQVAQTLHAGIGLLMIGVIIGHIYIGSIGMVGAFQAMWSGRVDRNWAKEHHEAWYRDVAASGSTAKSRTSHHLATAGAVASFAAGAVVAIMLALYMLTLYEEASITSTARTDTSAVHLGVPNHGTPSRQ